MAVSTWSPNVGALMTTERDLGPQEGGAAAAAPLSLDDSPTHESRRRAAAEAHTRRATWIGAGAVALWAAQALLTVLSSRVPPFQMSAVAFSVSALVGVGWMLWTRQPLGPVLRQKPLVWVIGVGGLFGYHFLYFLALKSAPAAEASLVNYLWPLLVVVFAGLLLPQERVTARMLIGGALGFAGTVVIAYGGGDAGSGGAADALDKLPGYAAAAAAAAIWAIYSVGSRRWCGSAPTAFVACSSAGTAALALLCGLATEDWVRLTSGEWLALLVLGAGPVGVAFYMWDFGMKQGRVATLGMACYGIPPLSTGLLIAAGLAAPSWGLAVAAALITGGAALCAKR